MLFPSVKWFQALCDAANANPERFRRLGTVDLVLVVKIDYPNQSSFFEIVFSGYHCAGVRELPAVSAAQKGAVVLEGPFEAWREMIVNIKANGQADLAQTLNTLTLYDTPMRVWSENQLDTDLFYRYQQNLQEFFDTSARFETEFAGPEAAPAYH